MASRLRKFGLFHSRHLWVTGLLALAAGCAVPIETPDYVYRDPGAQNIELGATAWSPSGDLAAVANYQSIWVFEAESGTVRHQITAHPDTNLGGGEAYRWGVGNTLLFMDDDRLVTTGLKGRVAVVDLVNDVPIQGLEVATLGEEPFAVAYSRASGALAVGGVSGRISLLEPDGAGGWYEYALEPLGGTVRDLQFSREGDYLAASGHVDHVQIWDLSTLEPFGALPVLDRVTEMALYPGGRRLLVAGQDMAVWYFLTGQQLEMIENPSMAGQRVALGAGTALMFALSIAAASYGVGISPGMPSFDVRDGPCDRVAALSADGRLLADRHPGVAKETIRVMDLEAYEVLRTLNPPGGATCDMVFSPDGRWLLLATEKAALVYDTGLWRDRVLDLPPPLLPDSAEQGTGTGDNG